MSDKKSGKILLVESIFQNIKNGTVTPESAQRVIADQLEVGAIKPLTKRDLERIDDKEMLAWAESVGLLAKSVMKKTSSIKGYGALVFEQYPSLKEAMGPALENAGKKISIEKDGESIVVEFQPFWRKVRAEPAEAEKPF